MLFVIAPIPNGRTPLKISLGAVHLSTCAAGSIDVGCSAGGVCTCMLPCTPNSMIRKGPTGFFNGGHTCFTCNYCSLLSPWHVGPISVQRGVWQAVFHMGS